MHDRATERSPAEIAAPGDAERDRIFLAGYLREIEIGAYDEEHGIRQRLRFDVALEVATNPAPLADRINGVINYDELVGAIEAVAAGERLNLIETFAEHVAQRLLAHPKARRVRIRIEKLDRLADGARLGCEITRVRADGADS